MGNRHEALPAGAGMSSLAPAWTKLVWSVMDHTRFVHQTAGSAFALAK